MKVDNHEGDAMWVLPHRRGAMIDHYIKLWTLEKHHAAVARAAARTEARARRDAQRAGEEESEC